MVAFFPYLFGGKTFLPTDLIDTMTAPDNATYGPPQAQNHYIYDGISQTYPYKLLTKEAFERGRLSYWNPHILGGYPQYAESLANNFDIFNFILVFLDPVDGIHVETALELLLAGIGMLFLLRFLGIGPLVNLLFAIGFMLNTNFIAGAHYRSTVASFCWVPFVVLMLLRYLRFQKKENLLYSSFFLALCFLAGNFQTSFFAACVVGFILLFSPEIGSKYKFLNRFGSLAFVGAAAFVLSAIAWLPTLELLLNSLFHGGSLNSTNVFDEYSVKQRLLSIPLLISFFFPELLGNAQSFNLRKIAGVDIMNFNGAIGFLPALFAVWGCFYLWKRVGQIRPFILIVGAGILLPIATPLFSILYHRFFIVATFGLSVVGALVLQYFLERDEVRIAFKRVFNVTRALIFLLVVVLIGGAIFIGANYQVITSKLATQVTSMIPGSAFGTANESWMYGRVEKTLQYYSSITSSLWPSILCSVALIILLSLFLKEKISRRIVLYVGIALTVVQLVVFVRTWFPVNDLQQFPIYPRNAIASFLQDHGDGSRYTTWRDPSVDPYLFPENESNVDKLYDIHGYESLTNSSLISLYKRQVHSDALDLRLLGLGNVKYVITAKRKVDRSDLQLLFAGDGASIYENLLAKPRAYLVYKYILAESAKSEEEAMARSDFDGNAAIFTREESQGAIGGLLESEHTVRVVSSENEKVTIEAKTKTKGILVLTDSYYPGWKCSVNGSEQKILRVNSCMRGVVINPGLSIVEFKFEPTIFSAGIGVNIFALLLFVSGIVFFKMKNHQENT